MVRVLRYCYAEENSKSTQAHSGCTRLQGCAFTEVRDTPLAQRQKGRNEEQHAKQKKKKNRESMANPRAHAALRPHPHL